MADSLTVSPITCLYRRFAELIHELAKFGLVGAIAAVLDLGGAAMLYGAAGLNELAAKTISTVVAATFAYAGNRVWTFRHRANAGLAREYLIFFMLNGIGLLIALLVIGFTTYSLGLHGPLAYNVAQVTGTGIGTIFRYWAYKKWVFLPAEVPAEAATEVAAAGPQAPLPARHPARPQPSRGMPQPVGAPDSGEPVGAFFTPVR
jgi:putative flippase GtrA